MFLIRLALALGLLVVDLSAQFIPASVLANNPVVRRDALQQLARLSESQRASFVPELVQLLREKEGYRAVLALAKVGRPAVPTLFHLLDSPERAVRGFAADAIAMIRPLDDETVAKLRQMLDDGDAWVRNHAAMCVLSAGIADARANAIITEEWKPTEPTWMPPAPERSVDEWIAQFAAPDQRILAADRLKRAGAAAIPALVEACGSNNPDIRAGAMYALQVMHAYRPEIEAAAIKGLKDPSGRVRESASFILAFTVSIQAADARLDHEIDEADRQAAAAAERSRLHTLDQVLAPVPHDADHQYPLEVTMQVKATAPDGTMLLVVLHTGQSWQDRLRIWALRQDRYLLLYETVATDSSHLSAGQFRYDGKMYVHVMRLFDGTGYLHEDEFYRVESGGLTKLSVPKGLPLQLAKGEGVWKGFSETFEDDRLEFQFSIWKEGDANCCPSAGTVKGTYTIVGDELRFATWTRYPPSK